MVLIRSTFWLVMAFMIIGPRVDINASLSNLSTNASQGTQNIIGQQTDISTCKTIDCVGTKIVLAAGVQAVGDFVSGKADASPLLEQNGQVLNPEILNPERLIQQYYPHPKPRISRAS